MKQGSGTSKSGSRKVEPHSHRIDPATAGEIGTVVVRTRPARGGGKESRALGAPVTKMKSHRGGSQGGY